MGRCTRNRAADIQPPAGPPGLRAGVEYEVPLMQAHCPANNNMASLKPSYF